MEGTTCWVTGAGSEELDVGLEGACAHKLEPAAITHTATLARLVARRMNLPDRTRTETDVARRTKVYRAVHSTPS
jgi:hypothetical protein